MKKIVIATLLMSFSITAQEHKKNDFEIAPYFGIASANYYGDVNFTTNNSIFSSSFGLDAYFYINSSWSFKMGIGQAIMGSNAYLNNNNVKEKLRFIAVPFHVNRLFGASDNWMFNFGPTISFLKGVNLNGVDVGVDGIRTDHIGLGFGVAYRYKITNTIILSFDYQGYVGFTNNLYHKIYGKQPPFIGNIYSSLSLKAIYKLGNNNLI